MRAAARRAAPTPPSARRCAPLRLTAYGTALLALLHAAPSAYWALGGTGLLPTVGGRPEVFARSGGTASVALLAALAVLKLAGCLVALALVRARSRCLPWWLLSGVALAGGLVLTLYGGVLTLVGAIALFGAFGPPTDVTALYWHVLLWDPWFLLWGALLTIAALRRFRLARWAASRDRDESV
ncbi:hypothetical protein FHX42_000663 [Saccharopolyspora lacisalsi]|uniref:DUF3995 domain-containing protein n=1 Tax=Halosaccharopolyspora lacisalsi TaxID=1000566 RepID=A0A839DPC1_9PSEU|nr:DUF3995 domain-containing protein [Halosaccharopolyspora lacisalsi]MBA8823334.1 hypothetical protein [Halosaccharopolyspora lacisalsi]